MESDKAWDDFLFGEASCLPWLSERGPLEVKKSVLKQLLRREWKVILLWLYSYTLGPSFQLPGPRVGTRGCFERWAEPHVGFRHS